jgi:hypothetical protein
MTRKTSFLAIILALQIGYCIESKSQLKELGTFMATGTADAEKLLEAYISPWVNGFGASLTGGWYNTAKTHKPGGFDLTLTGNVAFIPSENKTFNVTELNLGSLHLADATSTLSPSIAGKREVGPQLNYNIPGNNNIKAFNLPQGTGVTFVPSPMAQLSIGLFKDTEITGRYMPKVDIGSDYDLSLWGVGLKHGLKQWIPAIKKIPFLHLTLQGGYTRLTTNAGLNVTPNSIGLDSYNTLPEDTWSDQNMMLQISSFTANLLISADIPFVSFYGGVGFATTKSELKLQGIYPMLELTNSNPTVKASEKDPIGFQIKNQDGGVTKPRLNIGTRLKFGFFTLHADYTYANFNVFTAGIGLTFR